MKDMFDEKSNDNRIIAVALNLLLEENMKQDSKPVILVSKDALMRVKADAIGIQAEDFLSDRVITSDHIYSGYLESYVSVEVLNKFYKDQKILVKDINCQHVYPNQFVILKDELGSSASAIGRIDTECKVVIPLIREPDHVWGIKSRNVQQRMALELLLRDDFPLVTLVGKAGTGKTLLSLAAGLLLTEDLHKYKKLLVARPVVPVGKDLGYLPGEKKKA